MIEFKNVDFSYTTVDANGREVASSGISGLDLTVRSGEFVVLTGSSGCGKTVITAEHRLYFLRELADRMLILEKGRITHEFGKNDIRRLTFADTERLGIRPLVLDDIDHGGGPAKPAADTLTLENFCFTYKDGKRGIDIPNLTLSAKSIIAIVGHNGAGKSTLARNICGLDLAHMKQVAEQLKRLRDMGKTVFVVTHDTEFIRSCCDHIIQLENGKVINNYAL